MRASQANRGSPRRAAALALALLAAAATGAHAQNRLFNFQTNRWETLGPDNRARDVIEDSVAPGLPDDPALRDPARYPDAPAPARQEVAITTQEPPGTVIIDTERRVLFLVGARGRATRYPVGVGREGFGFSGTVRVGRKAEWPAWTPPPEMRAREAARGRTLPVRLEGGEDNPLGARALYLFRGTQDTLYRIHGTNEPWTVGGRTSSGCIRMRNEDVVDLYGRVPEGARVVVIGPSGAGRSRVYQDGA